VQHVQNSDPRFILVHCGHVWGRSFKNSRPRFLEIKNVWISSRNHPEPPPLQLKPPQLCHNLNKTLWKLEYWKQVQKMRHSANFNIILLLWCLLTWKNCKKNVKFVTFQAKITRVMVAPGSRHHKSSNFNEHSHRVSRPPAFPPLITLQFQLQCYGWVSIRRMPKREMSPKVGQDGVSVARNICPKFWTDPISCWA